MTSDIDIFRTANLLIREHGDQATIEAAQRADAVHGSAEADKLPGAVVLFLNG